MPGVSGASNHHLQPVNDCYCGEKCMVLPQKNRELSTYLGLAGATSCVLPSVKRTYITVERSTMLCSWVNPLEMAIFNSYFDITRGYNYSIKWIIIPLNPLFRLGHGFNRKL